MQFFQVNNPWKDIESFVKSPQSGLFQLRDSIGFMYAQNEPIVYFATTSPTAIQKVSEMFELKPIDPIVYHTIKMAAENTTWGFLGRADFFH